MAHKVERLERSKIFGKPHLISEESLKSLVEYLDSRSSAMMTKEELAIARDVRLQQRQQNITENKVALIPVAGVLTYEETFMGAICGMSSYQGINTMMRKAISEGAEVVVLDVDSGGGEAYGAFETAKELREMADKNNIRLLAYVDGISASAAYALSTAAHEIILNPYAETGSIGVRVALENDAEKRKKEGVERKYIFAGADKIPFNEDGSFKESFISDLQERVDMLYGDFVNHVAEYRNIDKQTVKDTEAKTFNSMKSVELGLADKVMERLEFAEYLADLVEEKKMPLGINFKKDKKEEDMSKDTIEANLQENVSVEAPQAEAVRVNEEMAAQLAELQAKFSALELKEQSAQEALKASAIANIEDQLAEFSFVEDAKVLASAIYAMEDSVSDMILSSFAKAASAIEDSVTEEMAIEGEAPVAVTEPTEVEKQKEATAKAIKAKYAVSE